MNTNALVESIKKHEGLELKVYKCPAGKLTIGYGRNLEDNGITKEEAEFLLIRDLQRVQNGLRSSLLTSSKIVFDSLPLHVQNVLIEMAYQIGVNGLMKFKKTLELIKNKDYEMASVEMLISNWAVQTPKRAKELSNLMKGGY